MLAGVLHHKWDEDVKERTERKWQWLVEWHLGSCWGWTVQPHFVYTVPALSRVKEIFDFLEKRDLKGRTLCLVVSNTGVTIIFQTMNKERFTWYDMMNLSLQTWRCGSGQMERLVQSTLHLSNTWHLNFRGAFYMFNISDFLCVRAAADRLRVFTCARLARRDEVRSAVKAFPPSPRRHWNVCLNVLARCFTPLQLSGSFRPELRGAVSH